MTSSKNYLIRSVSFFVIVSAIFLFSAKVVLATEIVINSYPSSVNKFEEFEVTFSGLQLEPSTEYFFKARIGKEGTTPNKGETYNASSDEWFHDSSAWVNFPKAKTNENGAFSGTLKARAKNTAEIGINKLTVRVRRVEPSGNIDSQPVDIEIKEGQSSTPSPSPTSSPSPSPSPTSYPSGIILSEFMPNPDDGNEWVEIKNTSSSEAVLTDWKIDDIADAGGSTKKFSATIPGGGYYKIDIGSGFLNNSGDEVRLLNPDGSLIDKTSYPYSNKGVSWIKADTAWCEAESSTPGGTNSSCRSQPSTATNTPTPTPKSTPTLKPVSVLGATMASLPLEQIFDLSRQTTAAGFFPLVTDEAASPESPSSPGQQTIISFLLIGGGLAVMAASAVLFLKQKRD